MQQLLLPPGSSARRRSTKQCPWCTCLLPCRNLAACTTVQAATWGPLFAYQPCSRQAGPHTHTRVSSSQVTCMTPQQHLQLHHQLPCWFLPPLQQRHPWCPAAQPLRCLQVCRGHGRGWCCRCGCHLSPQQECPWGSPGCPPGCPLRRPVLRECSGHASMPSLSAEVWPAYPRKAPLQAGCSLMSACASAGGRRGGPWTGSTACGPCWRGLASPQGPLLQVGDIPIGLK